MQNTSNAHLSDQKHFSFSHQLTAIEPLIQIFFAATGGFLILQGLHQKKLSGAICLGLGLGALLRAAATLKLTQRQRLTLHPTLQLNRTIEVVAPIELVFDFWKNFSNFSRFMSYIQEVKVNEEGGCSWKAIGPGGIPISWNSFLYALIPNQLIFWKSCPHSIITHSGIIRFKYEKADKTQVSVNLSYSPPAGLIGYQTIKILGFDPRDKIDRDLLVMKTLIESTYAKQTAQALRAIPFTARLKKSQTV